MSNLRADPEELTRLREQVEQLQTALSSRVVIEQAKGMLAERYRLEISEAFALLRYSARTAQAPLHELAARVVASRESPSAIVVGLSRRQRWRAAAQRERAEAHRQHAEELARELRREA